MRRALALAFMVVAAPALANHPEGHLDDAMAAQEPAFEATDLWRMPRPAMRTAAGRAFSWQELGNQVVVLSFVPEGCGAPCAEQQKALASVQAGVNSSPMRDMVTFLTLHPDRQPIDGTWQAANWRSLIPDGNETVASLAGEFAELSARNDGLPMVHIIDRGSRHAGIFHGVGFGRVNMILYINGLTNAPRHKPGILDRILAMFE